MAPTAQPTRIQHQPYSYRADVAVPAFTDAKPIIVFDGVCGFCSAWVRFVLRHDSDGLFSFLPAQSTLGRALYVHYCLDPDSYGTSILIDKGCAYVKAEGSLRVIERLGVPWSLARALRVLPMTWLDWGYDVVARNRLRIMGQRETCYVPDAPFKDRFLA